MGIDKKNDQSIQASRKETKRKRIFSLFLPGDVVKDILRTDSRFGLAESKEDEKQVQRNFKKK